MIYFITGIGIFLLFLYTTRSQKKFEEIVSVNNKVVENAFQELINERDELLKEKTILEEKLKNFSADISNLSFKEFTAEENQKMVEKLQERYSWYLLGNCLDNLNKGSEWTSKEDSK